MIYLKEADRLRFDILDENKKVGRLEFRSHGTVLYDIWIDEKNRNQGYGSAALKEALELLKKRGIAEVTVQATEDSINFYLKNGFEPTGERDGLTEYLFIHLE